MIGNCKFWFSFVCLFLHTSALASVYDIYKKDNVLKKNNPRNKIHNMQIWQHLTPYLLYYCSTDFTNESKMFLCLRQHLQNERLRTELISALWTMAPLWLETAVCLSGSYLTVKLSSEARLGLQIWARWAQSIRKHGLHGHAAPTAMPGAEVEKRFTWRFVEFEEAAVVINRICWRSLLEISSL